MRQKKNCSGKEKKKAGAAERGPLRGIVGTAATYATTRTDTGVVRLGKEDEEKRRTTFLSQPVERFKENELTWPMHETGRSENTPREEHLERHMAEDPSPEPRLRFPCRVVLLHAAPRGRTDVVPCII